MVLIYYPKNELKPVGGPSGYLYNLSKGIGDSVEIEFLPEIDNTEKYYSKYKNLVPKFILDIRRAYALLKELDLNKTPVINPDNYECIHFHSTKEMYLNRGWLDEYKGKVVLTSHSPCALHREFISQFDNCIPKYLYKKLDRLAIYDEYGFDRADYIVFPTEEAEEPYYHTWKEYSKYRINKKVFYMESGIQKVFAKRSQQEIRDKYGIPQDAFVVSYVGRHNTIKGYDLLKEIFKKINREDVWFLVAGKEEPLTGVKDAHWIEVGWTDDPYSIVAASDLFILPNRETYFDLVLLETLSLGIPCLISNTGGNKHFKKYDLDGIQVYDSIEDAVSRLSSITEWSKEKKSLVHNEIEELFEREYSIIPFSQRYKNVIDKILKD